MFSPPLKLRDSDMIFYGRFKRRREMSGKEHQAEAIELSFKKVLKRNVKDEEVA